MATTSIMPLHTGKGRTMERTLLAAQNKNTHHARWVFLFWWASQDLNPGPSGYEKIHDTKKPILLLKATNKAIAFHKIFM